jgi:hypothetical protein
MKIIVPSDDLHHRAGNQELCDDQAIDRRSLTLLITLIAFIYFCPFYRWCSRSISECIADINILFALHSTAVRRSLY